MIRISIYLYSMKITVRKAVPEDLNELSGLFDQYRMFYDKPSDTDAAKLFLQQRIQQKDSEIMVAELDGKLIGFTQLYPLFSSTRMRKYWLLNDLFVAPEYRGKGASKLLLEEAKTICRTTNACGILLETGKDNQIGNQLYPTCGFERYDHANFYEWTNAE